MTRSANLKRLLFPKSIAVIGGESARTVIRQCQALGYEGQLWAVNPKREEIEGLACYASVCDLPSIPDACFIGVPAQATISIVAQLAALGAGGAVCLASGFAELDDAGKQRQAELVKAACDMALVGPNCYGTLNYLDGIALWPDVHGGQRATSGAALIVQSGNIGLNLTFQRRGLKLSHVIAVGNSAQIPLHEYIDALLDDERVTAIGLHIEGLDDVVAFSKVALRALHQQVPLVAIKTGNSQLGAQMTMSHTNSMASSESLVSALFERYGIAQCNTLGQFIESLKFIADHGALQGTRIGSMSCSGGEASLMADLAAKNKVALPPLSKASHQQLLDLLGDKVVVSNPLDYHLYIWGELTSLRHCFTAMMENDFDCFVLILDYPDAPGMDDHPWQMAEQAMDAAAQHTGKAAVIVSTLPENFPTSARQRLELSCVTPMQGMQELLVAIQQAALFGRTQQRRDDLRVLSERTYKTCATTNFNEWRSKQLLQEHGLLIPRGCVVTKNTLDQSVKNLQFPLVLKALDDSLIHKSEHNAVAVDLRSLQEVSEAMMAMSKISQQFLLEEMVGNVVAELIVGIKQDPQFGMVLVLGAGGTHVELLNDTVQVLLPCSRQDLDNALNSLKIAPVLQGFRGKPAADMSATLDAIEQVLRFARAHEHVLFEMDINPLMVCAQNHGAFVADAFICAGIVNWTD